MVREKETARERFTEWLRHFNKRFTNPFTLTFAGRGFLAVVSHVGRRSGKGYQTPVLATPFEDGFVIPLPYGNQVDWCQNVLAAGGCIIQWHWTEYRVSEPKLVAFDEVLPAFSKLMGWMLQRNHVKQCLRVATSNPLV